MDEKKLEKTLRYYKAPRNAKINELFQELYQIREEVNELDCIEEPDRLQREIDESKIKIKQYDEAIEKLEKKLKGCLCILGEIVIRPNVRLYHQNHRNAERLKQISLRLRDTVEKSRVALKKKDGPKPSQLCGKKITESQQAVIDEYLRSGRDLIKAQQEAMFFDTKEEADAYAMIDDTRDLYYICKRIGCDIREFDQGDFVAKFLGLNDT